MLRGDHIVEFCGSDIVWGSKWDVGGEADLSQLDSDGGRCREREVESEKREERPLNGGCIESGLGMFIMYLIHLLSMHVLVESRRLSVVKAWEEMGNNVVVISICIPKVFRHFLAT